MTWTARRTWARLFSTEALAALAAACLLAAAARADPLPVTEIAPGVFVHKGRHEEAAPSNLGGYANIGFVIGSESVAVIDSGGSAAQGRALRAALRSVTDLPIAYVIVTHGHPDHAFGTAAFAGDGPQVVGHAKLPRALAQRGPFYLAHLKRLLGDLAADTEIVAPNRVVAETMTLDLGSRRLILQAHATAHSDNDLTVIDEATRTLWAGDLLFMERLPVIDGSLKGWLAVLETLRGIEAERVVPGHGPVSAPWPQALEAQQRYLETLLQATRGFLAKGGKIEQAVEQVGQEEKDHWLLFEEVHPRNIVAVFTELEWE